MVIKMENIYKRWIIILIIMYTMFMMSGCTTKNDSVRLRIVANSDSYIDQQNKIYIKNIIKEIYEENNNIEYYELLDKIKEKTDSDIVNDIKIEFKNVTYPAKSYNGKFIPSGIYPTVLITIGKGEGKNFWTMLYPDFFNISFEDNNEVEYRSYIYDNFIK